MGGKNKKKKQRILEDEDSIAAELEAIKNPGAALAAAKENGDSATAAGESASAGGSAANQTNGGGKKQKKKKREKENWEDDVYNEINDLKNGVPAATEVVQADPPKAAIVKKPVSSDKVAAPLTLSIDVLAVAAVEVENEGDSESAAKKKKKKKKKKAAAEPVVEKKETKKRGGPQKAMLARMKKQLEEQKLEKERIEQEEEELRKKEDAAEEERLAKVERERLKKEKKKQDKKDRIARQKKEGTFKTEKQKAQAKKNEAYLEQLKQQGMVPNETGEQGAEVAEQKPKRPKYVKKKKFFPNKMQSNEVRMESLTISEETQVAATQEVVQKNESEEVDDWEALDVTSDIDDELPVPTDSVVVKKEDSSEFDETESVVSSVVEQEPVAPKSKPKSKLPPRQQALHRISMRKAAHEAARDTKVLRSPVICVMGHVDTGKTKILDKLRHTNVQDGEAGGITQQIGATNVPAYAIIKQTIMVNDFNENDIKIPGLLIIDTPGHESFSNLRSRGSSNCDMAILVVDIMHGLEPQTKESIKMLVDRKVPFVIALNKIDRLYKWKENANMDVHELIKSQERFVQDELQTRVNEVVVQFAEQGLNVKLFYENDNPKTFLSMIPTSAHSGDGMGNLMARLVQFCQKYLAKRLSYSEELECSVLEVKGSQGLGTTVDVLLINGSLKYGDTIVLAGHDGPIVTSVKGLLMPEPMKEFRVKNSYTQHSHVKGAQGVRISAKDLDKALAGTTLMCAYHEDEIELLREQAQAEIDNALGKIKLSDKGVFVQASTLGSLEALLEFLKTSKIPVAGINIGPVHKKDVMKASVMLERDEQWAIIMAFDVKVEREAAEQAENLGVLVFTADIIYHLFDQFMQHRADMKKRKQEEFRSKAVFPFKLRILPNHVFAKRQPIVVGVKIEAGQLHVGTSVCVHNEKGHLNIGRITSIQLNEKPVDKAVVSQEVCIKIESPPGDTPKLLGRHFLETDDLYSEITRESIDIMKAWFRDEMTKPDWLLIVELKKKFAVV